MNDETSATLVCIALVAVCMCMLLGGALGHGINQQSMRKEAVRAGVAMWVVDDEGNTEFKWKVNVEVGK